VKVMRFNPGSTRVDANRVWLALGFGWTSLEPELIYREREMDTPWGLWMNRWRRCNVGKEEEETLR
jgi:hypothetical protein